MGTNPQFSGIPDPRCGAVWAAVMPPLYPAPFSTTKQEGENGTIGQIADSEQLSYSGPNPALFPLWGWGWDSDQPGRGAHNGPQGPTRGSHALCPSPAGMNPMPSFSAFALAFCRAVVSSNSAICRS